MRKLQRFKQLSGSDRSLLLEAYCCLGIARLLVLTIPIKRLSPHWGTHMAESTNTLSEPTATLAKRIGWAIQTSARYTPWKSNCLAQAAAAKQMLRRRGASSTLYLGVAKAETGELIAHAWVRCGELFLTGGQGHLRYTVVSTFAESCDPHSP